MYYQVGTCAKCGAPIYTPSWWNSVLPPPAFHTCMCSMKQAYEQGLKDGKCSMRRDVSIRRAKFVCEATRLHAICLKAPIIPAPWEDREEDFKQQFVELISDLCSGKRSFRDPEEAHDSWATAYREMGWKYGSKYDPSAKRHPDLVPYKDLDPKEKVKDEVFIRLVGIAKDCMWE